MTPAQLTALKAAIAAEADAGFVANRTAGATGAMADFYNINAVPDFWVWRTRVTKDEFVNSTSIDATVFSRLGTGFITRNQGERDAWRDMFDNPGQAVNPSLPQVRQAFSDIFSGATAPAPANRTHLSTVARRKATRAEKLFATGTGSTAAPAVMAFEDRVRNEDIVLALAS